MVSIIKIIYYHFLKWNFWDILSRHFCIIDNLIYTKSTNRQNHKQAVHDYNLKMERRTSLLFTILQKLQKQYQLQFIISKNAISSWIFRAPILLLKVDICLTQNKRILNRLIDKPKNWKKIYTNLTACFLLSFSGPKIMEI